MRKYIKTDLCNIMEQLANVNETLINKGKGVSQEQVQGILTDCQQSAVDVGNKIEEVEGEGTEAVRLLEEYCEKVYLLCINWPDEKRRDKELKNIRVLLNKVKNSILYDIKDSKKEVVFLPYKASMWDSLESVWKAADEDPDCDAYVIPIPYFDKNPDGSFKEMHYEGDLYPKYVPITDWQEYDLEKRHPDVIFIHNPYDEHNYVTSVHPNFYCKKIKNYTAMLMYIPYFVCSDNLSEHFCLLPGTMYADYVCVQSDKIKRSYLNAFQKKELKELCMGRWGSFEKKFIVSGSPKIDRALIPNKMDYIMPELWKHKIQSVKGKNKKILLLNTSLNEMLRYDSDKYINKLKNIFELVRLYEDVILWWRPHPLSNAIFSSMRTQSIEKYKETVQYFIEMEIGIYDDTVDMVRAIDMCDAYYGDWSSITSLIWTQKKPMMHKHATRFWGNKSDKKKEFIYSFAEDLGGANSMVIRENANYTIVDYLDDILSPKREQEILNYMNSKREDIANIQYANMGNAGEKIWSHVKGNLYYS